ncbi:MAG: cell division protein [Legionellales bacterium RIFCSPHIGHO2_12_FULL_42_9]|nr:MAG: cell division protein [Legionellales bacterium RIFCSPHIGHO2_12_FULL_42_9]
MLNSLRELTAYHLQAAIHSFNLLILRPITTIVTIVVIAVALSLPTLCWVLSTSLNQLTIDWQRGGYISLYVKTGISDVDQKSLLDKIHKIPGVGDVILKTPQAAMQELQAQEGMHDVMRYLSENPLPTVIDIVPSITLHEPEAIEKLLDEIKLLPQIEQTNFDREWVIRLNALHGLAIKITYILMGLLSLCVLLIVGNTLRLLIHYHYDEIRVLKLIGATDEFIARPLMYSGIWYGLLGAILAVLLINLFMLSIAPALQELLNICHMRYVFHSLSVIEAYQIVFIAMLLGWLSAKLSIKHQLSSIAPYN